MAHQIIMPHVTQPHSALARVERYIIEAKAALEGGDFDTATRTISLALGAVTFAANSQTKLIEACRFAKATNVLTDDVAYQLDLAAEHAESPGID